MRFEGFSTENRRLVQTVSTTAETLVQDFSELHEERLNSRGGHFTRDELIPVYFAGLCGVTADGGDYKNALFKLRDTLIRSPKLLFYIENELRQPTQTELDYVRTHEIVIDGDPLRTDLAKQEIAYLDDNAEQLSPKTERITAWLNRCVSHPDYKNSLPYIPVLLYYGHIGENEIEFLHFMSRIGIDVLYVCSDLAYFGVLKKNNTDGRMQIFELPYSMDVFPYPTALTKEKFATSAYKAERELETFFYDGTTVFKPFQFKKCKARTLKTTYEEVDILWHTEAKLRSGFDVDTQGRVNIPNLFIKVNGVENGNMKTYWDLVEYKLSPMSRVYRKCPAQQNPDFSKMFAAYKDYFYKEQINIPRLKTSPLNKYNFLAENIQDTIFEKMQEAASSKFLKLESVDMMLTIIHTGLNFDREILKILQKYDYTGDIPKIIYLHNIEETFTKLECTQLLLYNLLCFDIAIFTPTGYRNVEQYISEAAYEQYTMNEFVYKSVLPNFKLPSSIPNYHAGKYNKLFKRGRK